MVAKMAVLMELRKVVLSDVMMGMIKDYPMGLMLAVMMVDMMVELTVVIVAV